MSEIKVNKISPRTACGTTTLGDSGDTFTIPAGVSITNSGTASGFGATGAVSWNTTVKTSTFTAVAGEGYFVDTTSGGFTVNLPAGTAGAVVGFKDYANTFDTGNLTLDLNGSDKAGGSTGNPVLTEEGVAVTLVFIDSTKGWLVTDSGLQSEASELKLYIAATGGTITCSGDYKIHTFTGPGTFCVSCAGNAAGSNTTDYLVVAGAGGGGGYGGSGGGAGGFRLSNSTCMPAPLTSPLANPTGVPVSVQGYSIVVGGGGSAGIGHNPGPKQGCQGSTSTFSTISSAGGGGGKNSNVAGGAGGSGGGGRGSVAPGPASANPSAGGAGNTPPVSPSQGNNGGAGFDGRVTNTNGGGGGGAGAVGVDSGSAVGGNGGVGSFVVQTGFAGCNGTTGPVGSTRYFAGGGGGGTDNGGGTVGTGGSGGGGAGATPGNGNAGTTNTGGGGGGGGNTPGCVTGGNGGSGIVIIRYKFQN
jgi:hypothetical protein